MAGLSPAIFISSLFDHAPRSLTNRPSSILHQRALLQQLVDVAQHMVGHDRVAFG
jgi:hypothetical protein